jgi:hypothetical protein
VSGAARVGSFWFSERTTLGAIPQEPHQAGCGDCDMDVTWLTATGPLRGHQRHGRAFLCAASGPTDTHRWLRRRCPLWCRRCHATMWPEREDKRDEQSGCARITPPTVHEERHYRKRAHNMQPQPPDQTPPSYPVPPVPYYQTPSISYSVPPTPPRDRAGLRTIGIVIGVFLLAALLLGGLAYIVGKSQRDNGRASAYLWTNASIAITSCPADAGVTNSAEFFQFNPGQTTAGQLTGDDYNATLTPSDQNNPVTSVQEQFTATITGNQIVLNGYQGTINAQTLTLEIPQSDGTLGNVIYTAATLQDYNNAVQQLHQTFQQYQLTCGSARALLRRTVQGSSSVVF